MSSKYAFSPEGDMAKALAQLYGIHNGAPRRTPSVFEEPQLVAFTLETFKAVHSIIMEMPPGDERMYAIREHQEWYGQFAYTKNKQIKKYLRRLKETNAKSK